MLTSFFASSVWNNTDESLVCLWLICCGIVTLEDVSNMTHTCTHTHNGMKGNLGVCYVTTSIAHCFLCPASSVRLTAARVRRRWIMWCVSVRYNASFRCSCGLKSCTTGMTVISGSYLSLYSLENSKVGLAHCLILKGLKGVSMYRPYVIWML